MDWTFEKLSEYAPNFSEEELWNKLSEFALKAGAKTVYAVLLCYYVMISRDVLIRDKAAIIGALGYFILPLDLIPDFIPVMGFTDDLAAMVFALRMVQSNITPEIKAQAAAKLKTWFKDIDVDTINLFD